eukprot:scaffold132356_cov13-Tisochrysis_lutea.AAC.1
MQSRLLHWTTPEPIGQFKSRANQYLQRLWEVSHQCSTAALKDSTVLTCMMTGDRTGLDFYIFTALKEANTGLFAAGGFAAREFTNKAPKWKKDPKLFH